MKNSKKILKPVIAGAVAWLLIDKLKDDAAQMADYKKCATGATYTNLKDRAWSASMQNLAFEPNVAAKAFDILMLHANNIKCACNENMVDDEYYTFYKIEGAFLRASEDPIEATNILQEHFDYNPYRRKTIIEHLKELIYGAAYD